jgi:hypothetical protein
MTMLKFLNRKRQSQRNPEMSNDSQLVRDQIGLTAGEVWHALSENGGMSLARLAKQIDAPRDLVMQAVGWLARENKIQIVEQKRVKTISLLSDEQVQAA